ncbi:MAG: hypothetical protein D6742_13980 [Cyanobacteria bacterium J069]|nr:MAG: hypothetical protein D6742_13980 [Cyanobacteria bacterium J069]
MSIDSQPPVAYPPSTLKRARRAVACSPFLLPLFATMRQEGVSLRAIANTAGVQQRYTRRPLAELAAEDALLWLIDVGVLRREVDGQGLTDSFRLTPLGRALVEQWSDRQRIPSPTLGDRLANLLARWVRLPAWLQ